MTLKSDAKFEENLTCGLENNRNLTIINVRAKKVQRSYI